MNAIAPGFADALALETARVRLRPLAPADEALYCRIYGDAEIVRHVGAPLPPARARRSFAAALRHTHAAAPAEVFTVLSCDDGDIGLCGLRAIDRPQRRAEAGILLTARARGQGFAAEALQALVWRTFERLPIDEVYVEYSPRNAAMGRLAERTGFTPDAAQYGICRGVRRREAGRPGA